MFYKNVAGQHVPFGLVNASNGAALTGATVTVRKTLDGAPQAAAAGAVAELGNGQYDFAPSQADTNGNQIGYLLTAPSAIPLQLTIFTKTPDNGSGARTVAITVTDDADSPLADAKVRLTKGALSYTAITDADGLATFNIDDGTWTVAIVLAGYSFMGATLAVTADTEADYAMDSVALTASAPGLTTGFLYTYDEDGAIEPSVPVTAIIRQPPSGGAGAAYDATPRTVTSDGSGLAEFPNLFKGATYSFYRGDGTTYPQYTVVVPADAGDSYELPSVIGAP